MKLYFITETNIKMFLLSKLPFLNISDCVVKMHQPALVALSVQSNNKVHRLMGVSSSLA